MVDRSHGHTKATAAVARMLIERNWTVLDSDQPYQLRDIDGTPWTRARAKEIARTHAVPPEVRARTRARTASSSHADLHRKPSERQYEGHLVDHPVRTARPSGP